MKTTSVIHPIRRLLAFFMTLAMLLSAMPLAEISAAAGNGFTLSLEWEEDDRQYFKNEEDYKNSGATHEDVEDEDTFVSYSKTGEDAYVRLRVRYSNPLISNGYSSRGITIKVTGLRGAIRGSDEAPEAIIAADALSDSSKKYIWSYSYNSVEDAYYFTNNNAIEENTVFEGSFEIAWKLKPRETVHDFQTTVSATLLASGYTVDSNELKYQQKRLKDEYKLELHASNPYKYEVPLDAVNAKEGTSFTLEDSIWVKYSVSGEDHYWARDLEEAEEFRLYFPKDVLAVYYADDPEALTALTGADAVKEEDGETFKGYTVTKDIDENSASPYLRNIFVAYPKEYDKRQAIPSIAELWGRYHEDDEMDDSGVILKTKALIAATNKPEHPGGGYGYHDIPGDIYDVYKTSHGDHSTSIDRLVADEDTDGAIEAQYLRGGKEYTSDLELYLNFDNLKNPPHIAESTDNTQDAAEIAALSEDPTETTAEAIAETEPETADEPESTPEDTTDMAETPAEESAEPDAVNTSEEITEETDEAQVTEETAAEESMAEEMPEEVAENDMTLLPVAEDAPAVQDAYPTIESYNVEFVDDFIDIQTIRNNQFGGLRQLTDDEYHFTSVVIASRKNILNDMQKPIRGENVKVEVYVRRIGDAYTFEEHFTTVDLTDEEQTINFNAKNVVGVKVVFKGFTENIGSFKPAEECQGNNDTDLNRAVLAKCNYEFNISDEEMRYISTDGIGKVINNMFCNVYYVDDQNHTVWFNTGITYNDYRENDKDSYDYTFNRDQNTYAGLWSLDSDHGFDREKGELPIVEIPNYFKMDENTITRSTNVVAPDTYFFSGSMQASFELIDDTRLYDFSLYTIIPEHLRLESGTLGTFIKNGKLDEDLLKSILRFEVEGEDSNRLTAPYIAENCHITLIDEPDAYNGRQYLEFHFDFIDDPISIEKLRIKGVPMSLQATDIQNRMISITMRAAVMVHQPEYWRSNNTDEVNYEDGVWYNIDRDTTYGEQASFSQANISIVKVTQTYREIVKYVETPLTPRSNPNPTQVRENERQAPMTYRGGDYTYILSGSLDANKATDLIVVDVMEPDRNVGKGYTINNGKPNTDKEPEYTDWQGTFVSIDYSSVKKALGIKTDPIVYYSDQEEDVPEIITRAMFTEPGVGWTTEPENLNGPVRSIALDFGSAVAEPDTELLIKIHMLAPDDAKWGGQLAINQWHLGYTDMSKQEKMTLNSNVVPVTIVPDSRIILTKKDGTDKSLMDGVWFTLYKENGDELGVYDVKNGRIIVDNLTEGRYYFMETSGRKRGYEENTKEYWFSVSSTGTVSVENTDETGAANEIIVYNHRLPGQVTLQKISDRTVKGEKRAIENQKDPTVPVDGAKFSLYGQDETLYAENLETGKSYTYNSTNKTMTENPEDDLSGTGELHITGLEWGSYYLIETASADGYELTQKNREKKIYFDIDSENDSGQALILSPVENQQKSGYIKLVKKELAGDPYDDVTNHDDETGHVNQDDLSNTAVPNAVYDLYRYVEKEDGEGERLLIGTYFTNNKGELYVGDLAFGKYYFVESTPALGYEIYGELLETGDREANEIWFDIGPEDTKNKSADGIRAVYTSDSRKMGEVALWKLDDYGTPQPVVGAEYAMYKVTVDQKGIDPETGEEIITDYTYDENDKISFMMKDGYYTYLRPEADFGEGITSTQTLVTSAEGMLEINGLTWGAYLLKEIKAPNGYQLSDKEFVFEITYETVADKVYCYDMDPRIKGAVQLVKVKEGATPKEITDPEDDSQEYDVSARLDGAVFSIYREDGSLYVSGIESGYDYRIETVNGVRKAVQLSKAADNGTSTITDMDWGRYYFLETKAPEGFGLNPDKIRFSVSALSATQTQEIVVQDPVATCELKVTKKILAQDIIFAHGDPTFIFQVKQVNGNDKDRTFTKSLTFDEDYVNNPLNVDTEGYVIASVTFSVPKGTYEVSEIGVNRYELEEIDLNNPTVKSGAPDVPKIPGADGYPTTSNPVTVELNDTDSNTAPIEFIFKNKKKDQTGTSDTASVSNLIAKKRRLTAITAEYTGPTLFRSGEATPDWADPDVMDGILTVTAIYDDGDEERIYAKNSTIKPEGETRFYTLLGTDAETGDATITVVYIEDGIRKTATFTITFQTDLFEWWAMAKDNGVWKAQPGQFDLTPYTDPVTGKEYDGTICIIGYLGTAASVAFPAELLTLDDEGNEVLCKVVQVGGIPNNRVAGSEELQVYGMFADDSDNKNGEAPEGKKNVTAIQFADGIEIIGQEAFQGHSSIRGKLMIPPSMKEIRNKAFYHCSGMTGLTFTDPTASSLTYIGSSAFEACNSLSGSLILPDSVTEMGETVFYGCTAFNGRLHVPDNVTGIKNGTFYGGKFTSVEMPDTITKIGMGAFYGGSYSKVDLPDGLTEISVEFWDESIGEHKEINEGAFQSCTSLQIISFPDDSLETIGFNAFYGCSALRCELTMPDSVRKIGYGAFKGCPITGLTLNDGLTEISVPTTDANNTVESRKKVVLTGAFEGCTGLAIELSIPSSVTIIGYNAFSECTALKDTLIIPGNVTDIGYGAFYNCTGLTGLTFEGNSLKRISVPTSEAEYDYADGTQKITNAKLHGSFDRCTGLISSLSLPVSVELIGFRAFNGCNYMTGTLDIPSSIEKIGYGAFNNCYGFNTVVLHEGSLAEISVQVYEQVKAETQDSDVADGKGAFAKCRFTNAITIPNCVRIIGACAFNDCEYSNGAITIGKNVTYIGHRAFYQCGYSSKGVNEIKFAGASTSEMIIDSWAFNGIKYIDHDIVLPDNVTEIRDHAFYNCSSEIPYNVHLVLNDGLRTIANDAFSSNLGFKGDLTIPESVTELGASAFNSCGFNGKLQLSTQLTDIPTYAFSSCYFTGDLYIPENVASIGASAFAGSSASGAAPNFTGNLYIDSGVRSIGESAFGYTGFQGDLTIIGNSLAIDKSMFNTVLGWSTKTYTPLKFGGNLTIGSGVTSIEESAFKDFLFTSLTMEEGLTSIGESAFENTNLSGDLRIPGSVETIGARAFYSAYSDPNNNGYLYGYENVPSIGNQAFYNCYFKNDLIVPDDMTVIEAGAFKGLPFTGKLIIHEGVTSIGQSAFEGSKFTGELVIPDSVTSIGTGAFYGCSGFTGDLELHDGLTIGREAFYNCSGLDGDLYIGENVTFSDTGGYGVFGKCNFKGNLTVLSGNTNSGQTLTKDLFNDCKNFQGDLVIGGSITKIDNDAMQIGFKGTLTLQEGIEEIGQGAFWWYPNFTGSLVIPDSVQKLGREAFKNSGFTDNLTIGTGLTSVDTGNDGVFASCGFKGDLTINSGGYNGEPGRFNQEIIKNCLNFTGTLTVGGNVRTINGSSFRNCVFSNVVLEEGITAIENYAFWDCGPLNNATVTIPRSVTSLGTGIFYQGGGSRDGFKQESLTVRVPRKFESQTDPNWKAGIGSVTIEYYD